MKKELPFPHKHFHAIVRMYEKYETVLKCKIVHNSSNFLFFIMLEVTDRDKT